MANSLLQKLKNLTSKITLFWRVVLLLLFLVIVYLLIAINQQWWPYQNGDEEVVISCKYEVITAQDLTTGIIQDFPSDCDVPSGWKVLTYEDLSNLGLVGEVSNQQSEQPRGDSQTKEVQVDGEVAGTSATPPRTGSGLGIAIMLAGITTATVYTKKKLNGKNDKQKGKVV